MGEKVELYFLFFFLKYLAGSGDEITESVSLTWEPGNKGNKNMRSTAESLSLNMGRKA